MGCSVRRRITALGAIALLIAISTAFAEGDKPDTRDAEAIQKCIDAKTGRNWAWENCIGVVSEPCVKDEGSMPPSEVIVCYDRETLVWDSILNHSFRQLREALDVKQRQKLR